MGVTDKTVATILAEVRRPGSDRALAFLHKHGEEYARYHGADDATAKAYGDHCAEVWGPLTAVEWTPHPAEFPRFLQERGSA